MKSSPFKLTILLLFAALFTACGKMDMAENSDSFTTSTPTSDQSAPTEQTSFRNGEESMKWEESATTKVTSMLIRTADIRMQVDNYDEVAGKLRQMVTAKEGYIGGERSSGDANYHETSLDIRIPNQQFDALVEGIAGLAGKLDYKNISSQDVGEEYVDLEARLAARKTAEAAYLDILRSAKKVTDILEVQERLRQVREEIESAQGRMRYLRNQVDYSTITVTFYESHQVAAAAESSAGLGDRISVAFLKGWNGILSGIVGLTYAWPLWLLLTIIFILRKRIFSRTRQTKAANS